jgi:hypothetical protein
VQLAVDARAFLMIAIVMMAGLRNSFLLQERTSRTKK